MQAEEKYSDRRGNERRHDARRSNVRFSKSLLKLAVKHRTELDCY